MIWVRQSEVVIARLILTHSVDFVMLGCSLLKEDESMVESAADPKRREALSLEEVDSSRLEDTIVDLFLEPSSAIQVGAPGIELPVLCQSHSVIGVHGHLLELDGSAIVLEGLEHFRALDAWSLTQQALLVLAS